MGRHSAPDEVDDDAVELDSPLAVFDVAELRGRHASADDEVAEDDGDEHGAAATVDTADHTDAGFEHALTQRIAPIDAAPPVPYGAPHAPAAQPAAPPAAGPQPDKASAKAAKQAERQAGKAAKAEQRAAVKGQRDESDTKADLRVLREQPAVRAQVIGAVVASFLLYTLVLLALGHTDRYLVWLWVPIVACGVLVGLVLDLAHRRMRKRDGASG